MDLKEKQDAIEIKINKLAQELLSLKDEVDDLFEQKEAEEEKEWPQAGDKIYVVFSDSEITTSAWSDVGYYKRVIATGSGFRTYEEADFEAERRKVIAELKKYSKKYKHKENNYFIFYNHITKVIDFSYGYNSQTGLIYFESEEMAEKAIEAVGEERVKKYYLGVVEDDEK